MTIDLYSLPVTKVSGVKGKKPEELLALGITSVGELLDYYPFRYEDYTLRDLTQVKDGDKITVQAKIAGVPQVQMYGRMKSRMSCKIVVDGLFITAVWFNRHYLKDKLSAGSEIILTGKWVQKRMSLTVTEAEFPGRGTSQIGTLQPVYSVGGSITQKWFRQTMKQALLQFGEMIPEVLPAELLRKYDLLPRKQAVSLLHLPGSMEQGQRARRRMVYEELFLFQLKMQAYRALHHQRADGVAHPVDLPGVRSFVRSLPFALTESQKKRVG